MTKPHPGETLTQRHTCPLKTVWLSSFLGVPMPPARFTAKPSDPNTLTGRLKRYQVKTPADCDHELRVLQARLRILTMPQQMCDHLDDLDALLDRRHQLGCPLCPTAGKAAA